MEKPSRRALPADTDDLDEADREELHESLLESLEQMKRGELIDADVALAELRG